MSSNQRLSLVPRSVGLLLAGVCAAGVFVSVSTKSKRTDTEAATDSLLSTAQGRPLTFEVNEGQAQSDVRFLARGSGYQFFLGKNESTLALAKLPKPRGNGKTPPPEKVAAAVLRMRLAQGNPNPKVVGEDKLEGYSNYFIGRDSKKWRTNITNYARVRYKDVYPGIDLAYYGNQRQLEHDFIVKPGANPKKIRLSYTGAQKVQISKEGELLFQTAAGVVAQKAPISYQKIDGARKVVESRYVLLAKNEVGFELGEFDQSKALVIDPVLRYSRFIGGSIDEYPFAVTVDVDRNVYLTGYTGSFQQDQDNRPSGVPVAELGPYGNIPARNAYPTLNPLQNDPDRSPISRDLSQPRNGSADGTWVFSLYDAFVTKLDPNGNLTYSTYLGAEGDDYGLALAIDQSRNIYVTGMTNSLGWPLRFAFQTPTNNGFNWDAFAVKINAAGNTLLYSTYLGGSANERGRAIAVDGTGNAYIAGITDSTDFPTFARAGSSIAQPQYGGGANDAFLVSLNASGSAFNYSTYLGGTGEEDGSTLIFGTGPNTGLQYSYRDPNYEVFIPTYGTFTNGNNLFGPTGDDKTVALAVDSKGNAVMTGGTNSTDFFTTSTAIQTAKDTGYDAFVTQFTPAGLVNYSTYLGGDNDEAGHSIAFGPNQEIVLAGYTASTNFPTSAPTVTVPGSAPAFQASLGGGVSDAFVTKLDPVGQLGTPNTYSTYLGGNGEDIAYGVIVSAGGQAYVTGSTTSSGNTFPTMNPMQTNLRGGRDVFATKFRPNGSEYEYSTYIGGLNDERGMAIAVDVPGGPTNVQAYIAGFSRSVTYPTTLGGFDGASFPGPPFPANPAPEVIVTKLHAPPFAASGLTLTDIQLRSVDLAWVDNSDNEDGFEIERKLGPADSANLFAVVGAVGAGQVTFHDTNNVIPTITYTYRVRAFNQETIGGAPQTFYGAYSNQLTVTTLPELPSDASNLRVTPIDTSRLRLDWNDNSNNEGGFRIERASESVPGSGAPGTFQEVITTALNVTTFTDTGLSPDTLYFYRLFTFNAAGETLPLGPVSGRTLPLAPQVAPTNLVARAVSSNQVDLSWNFPVNNTDPDGFKVERSNDAGRSYILIRITTKQPGVPAGLTLSDTGVSGGSVYRYRVYAYNRSGDGPLSATNDATVLVAPSNLQGSIISTTQINLTWKDNSLAEDGYIVQRSTDGGATFLPIGTPLAANTQAFSDTTVMADGIYVYRVIAFKDTDAERDISTPTNLLNILALPSAPTLTSAHAIDSGTVQVDFVDNSTTETGFTIERDSGGGFATIAGPAQVGPSTGSGGAVSYTDTAVTPETTYTYRVRATNASGNSLPSTTDIAKVLAAPTNLVGVGTSSQVTLTWSDNSALNDNYEVQRSRNGGTYQTIAGNLGPNDTSYVDTTIVLDSVYDYRVRATASTDDFSSPAGPVRVTTPPGAPSNVQAVATSSSSVRVTWRDNSSTETSFRIIRSTNGGAFTPLVAGQGSLPNSGGTGTYTDNSVTAENSYTYRVIAVNGAVESAESPSSNNVRVLAAPSNLVVAPATSQTRLTVSFQDNSAFESAFTLERAPETTPGSGVAGTFALVPISIGAKAGTGGTVTVTDNLGLTAATRYFYRVFATTTNSTSSFSNVDDEVTLPNPPTDPTNLTLTVISKSDIQLTWIDTADNEDGFRVKRSTDGVVYTTLPNIIPASVNTGGTVTFDDNSVVEDTTYYYKVYAFNTGGNSAEVGPVNGTTPPKAPTNLVATLTARNLITVTWKDNAVTETDFDLERSDDLGNTFARIALVLPATGTGTTVTHLDGTVLPDKQYIYRVRARNGGGSSADSNTDAEFTPPSDPSNLRLSGITNTSITLFWNDNSVTETNFVIERMTGGGGTFVEIKRVGPGVNTYQDTGLTGNTSYTYRVKATNGAPFDSNYAAEMTGVTLPDPPAKPLNLVVTAVSQTMLVLNWDDTSNNEDGFKIERALDGVNYTQIATVGKDLHGYVDSPLNVGTRYWYRVRAYNAGGNSPYSDPADAVTFPPVPAGPTGLSVTTVVPGPALRLRWTDNSTNEQEFLIERSTDGVNFPTVDQRSTNAPNVTSYTDTNVSPNATYHYRVRSSNQGGASGPSNSASGTTLPAAPTSVVAVAQSGGSVTVSWTASNGGADGYVVFFTSAGQTAEAGRTSGSITTFTHTGLLPNHSFRYFVRAFNRSGYSTDSNSSDVTTAGVGVVSLELSSSRVKGSKTVTGTVRLNGVAPTGGAAITFTQTGDGASLVKPITLTIPAGQTTGTVKIKTKKAKRTANVIIRATYGGASAEAELTIAK